ncbi:hypothetical protein [Sphingomonas elodea]|uniref:hypothetical protein n=1 Tax=Sphingomonas elodea TaxID=179878 RepID=UPI000306A729|nr:hypothetical protein [Sphingomonas elodea]
MRLYRLGRAVDGLRALAHDGPVDTARDVVEIAREDLAALFEIIGDQVAHASADLARGSH